MAMLIVWLLLSSVVALAVCEQARYDGHKVLHIVARTARDIHEIAKMEDQFQLDFWHYPKSVNDKFHVRVSPDVMDPFLAKLRELEAEVSVWIDDLQSMMDYEAKQRREKRSTRAWDPLFQYQTLDEIVNKINEWHASYANMAVSLLNNMTHDGRSIQVVKITHADTVADRSIFIDCGIHAREWISPAFCLYVIDRLLSGEEDETLLKTYNWHIVPVLNPDGYAFSHTNDRMWRKNRRVQKNTNACRGVDLNRNFGYEWDPLNGGSEKYCSEVYSGTEAFSEPESDGLQRYILENEDQNFVSYITVHSYAQMWLYPWGYTNVDAPDVSDLAAAGNASVTALTSHYNTTYDVGSSELMYEMAGGSDDWAKGAAGIKYSYTLELRDTGSHGFELPADQIEETVIETWAGIKAMALYIA